MKREINFKKMENNEMLPLDTLELFNDEIFVLEDSESLYGGADVDSNINCGNCHCDNNCGS